MRVISRRRQLLERVFGDLPVEIAAADALDADSLARAVEVCDLVVDAIGLPPERMADHPVTAWNLASAAGATGAGCLRSNEGWSSRGVRSGAV